MPRNLTTLRSGATRPEGDTQVSQISYGGIFQMTKPRVQQNGKPRPKAPASVPVDEQARDAAASIRRSNLETEGAIAEKIVKQHVPHSFKVGS